jgi:hypothetical protein
MRQSPESQLIAIRSAIDWILQVIDSGARFRLCHERRFALRTNHKRNTVSESAIVGGLDPKPGNRHTPNASVRRSDPGQVKRHRPSHYPCRVFGGGSNGRRSRRSMKPRKRPTCYALCRHAALQRVENPRVDGSIPSRASISPDARVGRAFIDEKR